MIGMILIFASAAWFGFGLAFAGLLDPARIQGFLDVAGAWNPGPLFVMASAMVIYAVGFRVAVKRPHPAFATRWHIPPAKDIDGKLVFGAALFGVGWGLSGYCPGPAIAGLSLGNWQTAAAVASMAFGAILARRFKG